MLFCVESCEFLELSGLAVFPPTHGFVQCEMVDQGPVRFEELIGFA